MVSSSFGNLVKGDWVQDIHTFCTSYRALTGISYPTKFHLIEGHLQQFLEHRWAQDKSYKGFGCGYWSEQPFESVHEKLQLHGQLQDGQRAQGFQEEAQGRLHRLEQQEAVGLEVGEERGSKVFVRERAKRELRES